MKTVFISSFHQFISRNILHTPILEGLLRVQDLRVVIIVPADKKDYFEKEFNRPGLTIESIRTSRTANGFWSFFFKRLARAASDVRYRFLIRGYEKHQSTLRNRFVDIFFYSPAQFLARFRFIRTLMRFLDYHLVKNARVADLFKKYSPSVVFSTDVQNESDVLLMIEARRRGTRIIAMFRSWDNIETQGLLRVIPDALLVWGEYLRNEILRLDDIQPDNVKIVGVPHYDRYVKGPTMSRERFFSSIGADPARRLILFTPVGDMYLKENDADGLVLSELSRLDANILVRMPPADTVSFGDFVPPSNVFFYQPGKGAMRTGRRELSPEDDDHLINSLYFSDLVICGPSTIMLDAAVIGRPVLLFGFEKRQKIYEESLLSQYDLRYLKVVIDNGAAILARNISDFNAAITEYLLDPQKDAVRQKMVVEMLCFKADGKSSERVLDVLKKSLYAGNASEKPTR